MDIIEIALKKTTSKSNFNFDYLDKLISNWHEHNLLTTTDVNNYLAQMKIQNQNKRLWKNKQITKVSSKEHIMI